MYHDSLDPKTLKIWKKRLIVGGALVVGLGIVGCGAGAYGLYALGKNVSSSIQVGDLGNAIPKAGQVAQGSISNTMLNLAGDWALAYIATGEVQNVKHALRCIDALGGPDPGRMLETLAKRTSSPEIAKTMQRVSSELKKGQASHTSSCISFLAG